MDWGLNVLGGHAWTVLQEEGNPQEEMEKADLLGSGVDFYSDISCLLWHSFGCGEIVCRVQLPTYEE